MLRLTTFCILVAGLVPATSMATEPAVEAVKPEETYLLRFQFSAGETVSYHAVHQAVVETRKGDYKEKSHHTSIMEKHYEVRAIRRGGAAKLVLTVDRAVMRAMFNDGKPIQWDSASGDIAPAAFERHENVIGKPLAEIVVSPTGEFVAGRPLLTAEELKGVGTGAGDDTASRNFLIPLPENAVKPGDEWNDKFEAKVTVDRKLERTVKYIRKFRLVSVEAGVAKIETSTSLITPVRDPQILVQLVQRSPKGVIKFDIESGRIVSRTTSSNKSEYGWAGSDSVIQAVTRGEERLVTPTEQGDLVGRN
ncbi:hypothetical protein [Stratiformator vulcanicus]|uniref:SLA1 homology domain-containing protein n=1 Tax=Stratiformator vulcanicus TaxID=2527980 RepID=A0A517R242_9PLAN|nr:hypothetical protein [Stratiformator vulcanicus]QDT37924.1 hypothetical protein Pan189_23070 [Stratiformator vulcanicus]